jgi:hypothetical protein
MSLVVEHGYFFYLDGHKVLNDHEPIGRWRTSSKLSPTWTRSRDRWHSFYVPHDVVAAETYLRSVNVALVILDTQEVRSFDNQVLWFSFTDSSHYTKCIRRNYEMVLRVWELTGQQKTWFLGDEHYGEWGKIRTYVMGQHHGPHKVALKRAWLPVLAERLGALLAMRTNLVVR